MSATAHRRPAPSPAIVAVEAPGTVAEAGKVRGRLPAKPEQEQAPRGRTRDAKSLALAPRLLTLAGAAAYLSVSEWTVEQYIACGMIPSVELPRPATARAIGRRPGRPSPAGTTLALVRVDRLDLDRWVDSLTRTRRGVVG